MDRDRVISIVRGEDGKLIVLIDKRRGERESMRIYHRTSPSSLSRLERHVWQRHHQVTPFFTARYIGFTLTT